MRPPSWSARPHRSSDPIAPHDATITLECTAAEARERLQRIQAIGFDDVLLICQGRSEQHLSSVRALLP